MWPCAKYLSKIFCTTYVMSGLGPVPFKPVHSPTDKIGKVWNEIFFVTQILQQKIFRNMFSHLIWIPRTRGPWNPSCGAIFESDRTWIFDGSSLTKNCPWTKLGPLRRERKVSTFPEIQTWLVPKNWWSFEKLKIWFYLQTPMRESGDLLGVRALQNFQGIFRTVVRIALQVVVFDRVCYLNFCSHFFCIDRGLCSRVKCPNVVGGTAHGDRSVE